MTAAVYRTTQPPLSVPQTQNTAPVLEFNCLYTHDIRRKQKRWQDGFLRFHTFNKRVMVYDVPRNFIGDTHWKEDEAVQDGDEVTLEKDGVLVQVAESVGMTETDLTELRRSKNKGSSEHGSSPVKGPQTPGLRGPAAPAHKQGTQLKHRSLNALLGTPKGPQGKAALPTKSPFEERTANVENEQWEHGRPPKRKRLDQPPGWNVTRTTRTPAAMKDTDTPPWMRTADATKQRKKKEAPPPVGQRRLGPKEVIELSDDENAGAADEYTFLPGFSSDVLAQPSSPVKDCSIANVQEVQQPVLRPHSPGLDKPQPGHQQAAKEGLRKTSKESRIKKISETAHEDIGTGPRVHEGMATGDVGDAAPVNGHQHAHTDRTDPTEGGDDAGSKPRRTLRMASRTSKKKTLLCQDRVTKKPGRVYSTNTESAVGSLLNGTAQDEAASLPGAKSQRRLLQERLAQIQMRSISEASEPAGHSEGAEADESCEQGGRRRLHFEQSRPDQDLGEDATSLTSLDQMITPSSKPRPAEPPERAMAPPPKKDRPLRKAVSEVTLPAAQRRAAGAPMRFSPSPSKQAQAVTLEEKHGQNKHAEAPTTLRPKSRPKKAMQRSVSLNTTADGPSAVIFRKPFQTPQAPGPKARVVAEKAPNPWSREAFDLFAWRPPGWDEERWCHDDMRTTSISGDA